MSGQSSCYSLQNQFQLSQGGGVPACTQAISVLPVTSTIVRDPLEKVAVVGPPRTCTGPVPLSYINAERTQASLRALELAGVSPTAYLPAGLPCAGQAPPDNVAVLERGYAFRVQGEHPFESNSISGTAATSTNSTLFQLQGGATPYGGVELARNSTSVIVAQPAPASTAFVNVDLGAGLGAVTPQQLASVTSGGMTAATRESLGCTSCGGGAPQGGSGAPQALYDGSMLVPDSHPLQAMHNQVMGHGAAAKHSNISSAATAGGGHAHDGTHGGHNDASKAKGFL